MRRFWLLLVLLAWALPVRAEIEISAPGQQEIPLALVPFLSLETQGQPELIAEFNQVLENDLVFSGLFRLIDRRAFLADAGRPGLLSIDIDFAEWRLLGAEMLIKGGYRVVGEQLIIEARLFDVRARRLLDGRRYVGRVRDVRRMAHTFADQVLKVLTGEPGPFSTRIAFVSDATGRKELYVMDVDGHNPVRLTNHRSIVLNPDFSADGRKVLFTSYRDGNTNLYLKEIYTGRERRISSRKGLNVGGRFSPVDDHIVLTLSKDGDPEIYLLEASGKILQRLTRHWGIDIDPSWAPDGRRLAFVSNRRGNPHIFIREADGSVRRLTLEGKYNATPAWSPKGDRIAFTRKQDGRFDIYTIRPDGSDERRLTFGPGNKEHPRW
ncbi:MAG: Tol-Pal system beta propeller repeat protein TolB, partial [Deltaproteobacteria bacterium]